MAVRPLGGYPARVTAPVVDTFAGIGRHTTFYGRVLLHLPSAVVRYWRHVLKLIGEISFGSASLLAGGGTIGVVFAMSAVASTQIGLEGYRGLDLIGLSPMTGLMSALVNTREIAPVVASIALAAKVGTGFTAQLGAMRISDEIDALETMAVPSLPFLVSTRMAAAFISVIPLYLVGLFASYAATSLAVVHIKGQSSGTYDYYFQLLLTPTDVLYSLLKAVIFAVIITLVHCGYGYYATGGPEGVGRAAGRALRTSIVTVTIVDVLLTIGFWGLRPTLPGLGA
ncbi:phospholipid/cholesterol/gamma-HCH transport system permease protein [Amycolatopsis marina]|uniref:Phospholipid/cholesterol/gamma-HCH transport system permease protein n=1 Tax=Amycolatopsis marina TaxID=490629 RepID=A0A1I0ZX25_9PSEU|nr:ABC transporter permease [Amycolatopsis marina]SFB28878.1 phospholipid/cholesterol/gamma-HCH transport system permease protein [Amycolatopsis marina]